MSTYKIVGNFPPASKEQWLSLVEKSLKGKTAGQLCTETEDGIVLDPLYTASEHVAPFIAMPDSACKIMQRVDIPEPGPANRQAREDLAGGADGLQIITTASPAANGFGVKLSTSRDIERLLDGIDIDLISVSLDAGHQGISLARLVVKFYRDKGIDLHRTKLNLGADFFGAFAHEGIMQSPETAAVELANLIVDSREAGHCGPAISADGRVFHNAGASDCQELAIVISQAVQYLRWLERAGLTPDQCVPRIGFWLSAGANQFETTAKFRAVRQLWDCVQRSIGLDPANVHLSAETSLAMMARDDAHVNMLRVTSAAFGACIGGADCLTVLPFSIRHGLPCSFARRMARNSQIILQQETAVNQVSDAAAGSGFVDSLTEIMAKEAWQIFQDIEAVGGLFGSLETGHIQGLIDTASAERLEKISTREIGLTGVSEYPISGRTPVGTLNADPASFCPPVQSSANCKKLLRHYYSSLFENLRDSADAIPQPAVVFLANLGRPSDFTARSIWLANLLAAGGIKTEPEQGYDNPDSLAKAFGSSASRIACICSNEKNYDTWGDTAALALRKAGATWIIRAGKPDASAQDIDTFVHEGINVVKVLKTILYQLGEHGQP